MAKITKTGVMYLRPSSLTGEYTTNNTPSGGSGLSHGCGWVGNGTAAASMAEVTADDDTSYIWTYCTSPFAVQEGECDVVMGLCNEIPNVDYRVTSIQCNYRMRHDASAFTSPKVKKMCLTLVCGSKREGDESEGGTEASVNWNNYSKGFSTSTLTTTSYKAGTIPSATIYVCMRTQGAALSGQFALRMTQMYLTVTYEYDIEVNVNDTSVGNINLTGADGTPNAQFTTSQIGGEDHYFAGWYTNYDDKQPEHYKYTNKVGTDLTYDWIVSSPTPAYQKMYAVWYKYPIQIASGNKRVKHIYAGQTEITSIYSGSKKIYWPNARWEELT